ncbi:uncharacterized protein LOC129752653 [Uranotaenia lowii]|uniref:uncharacterized protein LOC129752653 n=1 Tax=Uranotaenia lowii TaxID=190385 RepID=UPI002478DFA7|nr:uncharacterized protein LOC129752653 [Uranotaenia lowii]
MSSSDMACDKCAKPTSDSDSILCQGLCSLAFHLKCAGLLSSHLKSKADNRNLLWVCDECCKLLKNAAFRRSLDSYETLIADMRKSQASLVADMKSEIAATNLKLDKLMNVRPNINPSPRVPAAWPRLATPSNKRRRIENPTVAPCVGTRRKTTVKTIATVAPRERKFWIYLARLQNSVTAKDIEEFVMECLQCESAEVHALVRKDVDVSTLRSISFKVGVDLKLKDSALSPKTWPAGILFREFEDFGSKNPLTPAVTFSPVVPSTETPGSSTPRMAPIH